jgi:hypothetical protein
MPQFPVNYTDRQLSENVNTVQLSPDMMSPAYGAEKEAMQGVERTGQALMGLGATLFEIQKRKTTLIDTRSELQASNLYRNALANNMKFRESNSPDLWSKNLQEEMEKVKNQVSVLPFTDNARSLVSTKLFGSGQGENRISGEFDVDLAQTETASVRRIKDDTQALAISDYQDAWATADTNTVEGKAAIAESRRKLDNAFFANGKYESSGVEKARYKQVLRIAEEQGIKKRNQNAISGWEDKIALDPIEALTALESVKSLRQQGKNAFIPSSLLSDKDVEDLLDYGRSRIRIQEAEFKKEQEQYQNDIGNTALDLLTKNKFDEASAIIKNSQLDPTGEAGKMAWFRNIEWFSENFKEDIPDVDVDQSVRQDLFNKAIMTWYGAYKNLNQDLFSAIKDKSINTKTFNEVLKMSKEGVPEEQAALLKSELITDPKFKNDFAVVARNIIANGSIDKKSSAEIYTAVKQAETLIYNSSITKAKDDAKISETELTQLSLDIASGKKEPEELETGIAKWKKVINQGDETRYRNMAGIGFTPQQKEFYDEWAARGKKSIEAKFGFNPQDLWWANQYENDLSFISKNNNLSADEKRNQAQDLLIEYSSKSSRGVKKQYEEAIKNSPVRIKGDEDLDKIKTGQRFKAPDGTIRIKQ